MKLRIADLKNIGVTYADWVLRDINLTLEQGDIIGIHGQRGAGKTTLLNILSGIILPHRGQIFFAPGTRAGLFRTQAVLNPYLNGVDNVILKGLYCGISRQHIHQKMSDILTLSGLSEHFYALVGKYSSSMRAHLNFAIYYFFAPEILLLDEGLGLRDPVFRKNAKELLQKLVLHENKTLVLASHDMKILTSWTDKIYSLEHGVLVQKF